MAIAILDSQKNLTSKQLSHNTSNQVYKSQLLANPNANEISSMHRNQVSNKNDDINKLFKIYHKNTRGIKGKINEFVGTSHKSTSGPFQGSAEHPHKQLCSPF